MSNLAACHKDGKWIVIDPEGKAAVDMTRLPVGQKLVASWIDPGDVLAVAIETIVSTDEKFELTHEGWEDELLILDVSDGRTWPGVEGLWTLGHFMTIPRP